MVTKNSDLGAAAAAKRGRKIRAGKIKKGLGKYTVLIEKDEKNWWTVCVAEIQGARTQGQTLINLDWRVRDCLANFVADSETAELTWAMVIPPVSIPAPL